MVFAPPRAEFSTEKAFEGAENTLCTEVFWVTMALLVPLSAYFESMKELSYLSITALSSIVCALFYIMGTDLAIIMNPTTDLSLSYSNVAGLPYFFGIALFMFEGNATAMEIY